MKEKMRRFLSSIGIEDPESLDLDFGRVYYKDAEKKALVMEIEKDSPWVYSDLSLFTMALSSVLYSYEMVFSYHSRPTMSDLNSLFEDLALECRRSIEGTKFVDKSDGLVIIESPDQGLKEFVEREFQDLIEFINYPYKVEFGLEKAEEEKEIENPEASIPSIEETPQNETEIEGIPLEKEDEEVPPLEPGVQDEAIREAEEHYIENVINSSRQKLRRSKRKGYKEVASIRELLTYSYGRFQFKGYFFHGDPRLNLKGKMRNTIYVGDDTDCIQVSLMEGICGDRDFISSFGEVESSSQVIPVTVMGRMETDYKQRPIIYCERIEKDDIERRFEITEDPRVELHLHTKFSAMDGTGDISDYCATAKEMGMKAIAITDHGDIQGFPAAEAAAKKYGLKMLYGCEFYMFDFPIFAYRGDDRKLEKARYCVFDFETTGLSNRFDRITEFGATIMENGMIVDHIDFFVNAGKQIPEAIVRKTQITNEMIKEKGISEEEAIKRIEEFMGDSVLVSHNAPFDIGFLNNLRKRHGLSEVTNCVVDTLAISYYLFPKAGRHTLGSLSRNLGMSVYDEDKAHRADFDAEVLAKVWDAIIPLLEKAHPEKSHGMTLKDLSEMPCDVRDIYTYLRSKHVIVLVKNQRGLKNLYKLISEASTQYLAVGGANPPTPKIPRGEIEKYREDFLIGSACYNGDVFEIASRDSLDALDRAVSFYDYIELQPRGNYSFLVNTNDYTWDEIKRIQDDIIASADRMGKRIVATGDCHYVDPRDKITRDVYIAARGLNGSSHPLFPNFRERLPFFENPDQHFRSTSDMLKEFAFLGDRAHEVVVENSNWVADQIEPLKILKDHLYTPNANLPGSEQQLRSICYENLRKTYGEHPDQEILDRLERELNGIIGNGYSVTYMIAHKICKKTNEDGYIFGSRGSVGSSFAANMAGVTEVNPLRPHYLCPKCHHFEWANDPDIRSGFDLDEKNCPECGSKMNRNGQSIPFETFLGFHAEKVPDIDLNFPGDYQARAFAYARSLLSTPEENEAYAHHKDVKSPHVVRAGTISTIQLKNAIFLVRTWYYPRFLKKQPTPFDELNIRFLATRSMGVKKTTGQHPGGIVVIPADMDIFDFTAYQHPADDPTSDWLTTHYDIDSMHESVLKLDLLGHVDPLALRLMSQMTGIDIHDIPFDDQRVISLFNSVDELGLKTNPLHFKTGAMGTPEFGTDFVQGLLEEARPKTFNELLIVSGLSHGKNVWNSNAQDLVKSGICNLNHVVGCRDDIMNYTISMGVESSKAFALMEDVRKGRGVKPELEEEMKAHGIPDYYIASLKKISYLFPRAHATAYVMEAFRVMWFKLYHPLEFYATFFSVRCDKFDLAAMAGGIGDVLKSLEDTKAIIASRETRKKGPEEEIVKSDKIAIEMLDRGYKIEKVNLMESETDIWKVVPERDSIIPPFKAIPSFPIAAAQKIVEERKNGEFLSKEDLMKRCSVGSSVIDLLEKQGALEGLGESNQLSLFDFSF